MIIVPSAVVLEANFLNEFLTSSRSLKKSRCSASTFNMTLYFGLKLRKLFVYSHASVMKTSELPTRRLPLIAFKIPPTEIVGSVFASRRT